VKLAARWLSLAVGALVFFASSSSTIVASTETKKSGPTFGALRIPDAAEARKQAESWLRSVGKTDTVTEEKLAKIWKTEKSVFDRVIDTICLGDPAAAKLLAEAKDSGSEAPTKVPALLEDSKKSSFYVSNLALAYGKALVSRKIYEDGLEALMKARVDDVVDPASFLFHKAVCEHALMIKGSADSSIDRLLVDATDSPERYRTVAALMHYDMLTWKEKDLGWIARKMDNIQRRLDLQRGGKHTQKMQKEVLVRLEEMIKERENQPPPDGPNDGNCPPGGPRKPGPTDPTDPTNPTDPATDPYRNQHSGGTGKADEKPIKHIVEMWGKLPEKEREKVMQELRQRLPAKDRAVMDAYIREMKNRSTSK
jgi:hypothetical protein